MPTPLSYTLPPLLYPALPKEVPAAGPYPVVAGHQQVQWTMQPAAAHLTDPTCQATVVVYGRPNAQADWQVIAQASFAGGGVRVNRAGAQVTEISLTAGVVYLPGWQLMALWQGNRTMTVSGTLVLS